MNFLNYRNVLVRVILLGASCVGFGACSSDEQEGEQLENDISQNAGNEEEGTADAEGSNNSENEDEEAEEETNSENAAEDDSDTTDGSTAEIPPAEPSEAGATDLAADSASQGAVDSGNAIAPPSEPSAAPAPSPSPAPDSGLWDPNRLVRFITADGTPVFPSAQAGGTPIATLRRGDHVMVVMQGDWGMITQSAYVQGSSLSEKAVPRTESVNSWMSP